MIDWKTIRDGPEGDNTLAADLLNVQINRLTFRDVWRKYFTDLFPRNPGRKWPSIMCHVVEEPWEIVVYPFRKRTAKEIMTR